MCLLLKAVLIIYKPKQQLQNCLYKHPETDLEIVGNNMQVVLDPFPNELVTDYICSTYNSFPTHKVAVEVLPLYICCTKGYKNQRYILGKELGLYSQAIALILPKRASPSQIGLLTDNLINKLYIIL